MKLYPDALTPDFTYEDLPGGGLRLGYRSHRPLSALAEGLILGVGDRFDETLDITRHEPVALPEPTAKGASQIVHLDVFLVDPANQEIKQEATAGHEADDKAGAGAAAGSEAAP